MTAVNTISETTSEQDLISRAQQAVSQCNWEVGECAAVWTQRYAKGRTDADFAVLVGLSPDQVYQRRRVWETFGDVCDSYPQLKWSHFYAALTWEDAADCLQWAQEIQATVAEMKAWRRAQRGEDLTLPAEEEYDLLGPELTPVRYPDDAAGGSGGRDGRNAGSGSASEMSATVAGVPRASDNPDAYAPFNDGAITPMKENSAPRPEPTPEQIVKRMTTALERFHAAMSDGFAESFAELSPKVRKRFLKAAEMFQEKVSTLE